VTKSDQKWQKAEKSQKCPNVTKSGLAKSSQMSPKVTDSRK